jgi:hypothetical protein
MLRASHSDSRHAHGVFCGPRAPYKRPRSLASARLDNHTQTKTQKKHMHMFDQSYDEMQQTADLAASAAAVRAALAEFEALVRRNDEAPDPERNIQRLTEEVPVDPNWDFERMLGA